MECYFDKNKELLSILKYYGYKDLLGIEFAKNVINNLESLENNADSLNCTVSNFSSLYQYLWTFHLNYL